MSFRIQVDLTIGQLHFSYVNEAVVRSSFRQLTDTCTIKLPRNLATKDGTKLEQLVKAGDKVTLKAGYEEYGMVERFTGYVSESINASNVVAEIKCENEMWALKQVTVNKSWPSAELTDVLTYLRTKANATWPVEVLGTRIMLGALKFERVSIAQALAQLKQQYGILCFFRRGALVAGKPYPTDAASRIKVELQYGRNVISWKDLMYKRQDEVKLKVKVVNHLPDGSTKEFETGDADGEQRTLDFYNRTEADLQAEAQQLIEQMKYDGYRGRLPLFGHPVVLHGDVLVINNTKYPERNGEYFCDAVETIIKVSSIRQVVEPGFKAN